jgi:hypothetical protein
MKTEDIIRQAVKETINTTLYPSWDFRSEGDSLAFENLVVFYFQHTQKELAEKEWKDKQIFVDMNEVNESYIDGLKTGTNWKDSYRPGGPWFYHAEHRDSDKHKALAAQLQANHFAWLQGFDDAIASRG